MFKAMVLFTLLALGSGLSLLYIAFDSVQLFALFLILGLLAIVAAITYTAGSHPYGYAGLGDISVFLFFGWLGVFGTFFLHTYEMDWLILLPASTLSFFSVAVLNINNIRDIDSDKKAGKYSIPVRIGRTNAVYYHYFLLIGGIICALAYVFIRFHSPFQIVIFSCSTFFIY